MFTIWSGKRDLFTIKSCKRAMFTVKKCKRYHDYRIEPQGGPGLLYKSAIETMFTIYLKMDHVYRVEPQ
jgi:hypothetical protein